ncbi:MAG: MgtC/SapB family protein [Clostridiales bacterium]|nr:MgtC/SapB family protein [Clostridiales bacterium]
MNRYIEVFIKILMAFILGGVVGYERENKSRPAGLRTHILVAIGATLVQITSINYYRYYGVYTSDPMRLGAQVISGIGFLGAGTILKEGLNIKGLTTAASVWTIACIGLAVGAGLYLEAIIATSFIYILLRWMKPVEDRILQNKRNIKLKIYTKKSQGIVGKVSSELEKYGINTLGIKVIETTEDLVEMDVDIKTPYVMAESKLLDIVSNIDIIDKVIWMGYN